MLVRLMYASRAIAGVDTDELQAILKQSKERNQTQGVTGVLCLSDGIFIQVLEGGRQPVSRLYNRIAADRRHTDVELLAFEEVGERRFAGWSMGLVHTSRMNRGLVLKYSATAKLDPYTVSGSAMAALFAEMVDSAAIIGNN